MPRSYRSFAIVLVAALLTVCISIFSMTMNTTTTVSAVEANGVGVYWDSNCNNRVTSIDWDTLKPGSSKNIGVYVQNEESEPMFLIMSTKDWYPYGATKYINLEWDYTMGQRLNSSEVLPIVLTLSISRHIEGISNFNFNIVITGSQRLPGDVNDDGKVNILDISSIVRAMSEGIYDQLFDLDLSGPPIDILDVAAVASAMAHY